MGARAHLDEALLDGDLDVTHRPRRQAVGWRGEGEPIERIGTQPGRRRIDVAVQIRGALLVHGGVPHQTWVGVVGLGRLSLMLDGVTENRATEEDRPAEAGLLQQLTSGQTVLRFRRFHR